MKNQLFPWFFQGGSISAVAPPCFFHEDFGVQTGEIAPFQQRPDPIWGFSHIEKLSFLGQKKTNALNSQMQLFQNKKNSKNSCRLNCVFFFSAKKKTLRSQLGWLSHQRFFAVAAARLGVRANDGFIQVRPFFDEGFFWPPWSLNNPNIRPFLLDRVTLGWGC